MSLLTSRTVTRRTLAVSAAWSVPAVAIAGTTPAFAASVCVPATEGGPTLTYEFPNAATPGKGVRLETLQIDSGTVHVVGLPAGVKVTEVIVKYEFPATRGLESGAFDFEDDSESFTLSPDSSKGGQASDLSLSLGANTITVTSNGVLNPPGEGDACGHAAIRPWTLTGQGDIERQYNSRNVSLDASWTMTISLSDGSTITRSGVAGPFTSNSAA